MKKLRIAMLSPIHWRTPPRDYGPWELVSSNLTEELVRRGHDVTLYATGDSITTADLRWVAPRPILEDATLEGKVYNFLHAALPFEEADNFDIIHNHYDGYPLVFSQLVQIPIVSTVHGFSSPQITKIYQKYDQVAYVSISNADRHHAPDINWAANIYHGIDLESFNADAQPDNWLGSIGRIHPDKGTAIAIRAALAAGQRIRVAGGVDQNDTVCIRYWQEEVEPLIDDKSVVYVGELSSDQTAKFYQSVRAVLCPLQWDEPFGLVFAEAMACGTPVIAYARGSAPELITSGTSGYLVRPDDFDGLVSAITHASALDRRAVRSHAEQLFSIPAMTDRYEDLYYRLIKEQSSVRTR